jgi:hypothetical protein
MRAVFKLPPKEIYKRIFYLLNAFQTQKDKLLTDSEIDLLAEFLILPKKKFEYQPFSTVAKNKVIESTEKYGWILSRENINNKIYSLVQKGYLTRDEDNVVYFSSHIKKLVDKVRTGLAIEQRFLFPVEFILKEDEKDETQDQSQVT